MSKCNKSWIAELIISRSQYYAWGIRYCPLALAAKSPKHQQMVSNASWGKTLARQIARFQKYLVTWFTFSEVSHKYLQLRVMSKYHMCYFSPIMFKAKLSSPMIRLILVYPNPRKKEVILKIMRRPRVSVESSEWWALLAWSKPLLAEFHIPHRLESSVWQKLLLGWDVLHICNS